VYKEREKEENPSDIHITFSTMSIHDTHATSFERLPVEIFLQIFSSLSLQEIVTAFFDLNSYINAIIRCVKDGNHTVAYNDTKAVDLLHSFPTQFCQLIITYSPAADLTSLINLRSLTIKYGTLAQLDGIRPEHFPMLEILHIRNGKLQRKSLIGFFYVFIRIAFLAKSCEVQKKIK
jgi:hypothetical protein